MLELLSFLLEIFGELLLQLLGEAILDLAWRALSRFFGSRELDGVAVLGLCLVLGAFAGGFSLLVAPQPLVHPSRLHGISLLISPVLTGAIMFLVGSTLRRKGKRSIQIEAFWYGFAFAFSFALVRLIFTA